MTGMSLKNIMLNERSLIQKITNCTIPFVCYYRKGKIVGSKNSSSQGLKLEGADCLQRAKRELLGVGGYIMYTFVKTHCT